MFDWITIRARVSDDVRNQLVAKHSLRECRGTSGAVEYDSSGISNIHGLSVSIKKNVVTLRTSLHKYYDNRNFGTGVGRGLNVTLFDRVSAVAAFHNLLAENFLREDATKVLKFEIGLNLHMKMEPVEYIKLIRAIGVQTKCYFEDANYRRNRQKTTEKHKDIRKFFKIYDKGFERFEKERRKEVKERGIEENLLRIETVYKRNSTKADNFLSDSNINRLFDQFFEDWSSALFLRRVRADKGIRKSELDRAERIFNIGPEEYMRQAAELYKQGHLTEKQYRTIREFVRDFDKLKHNFKVEISPLEKEFFKVLKSTFTKCCGRNGDQ
jgi:hypothetical protein